MFKVSISNSRENKLWEAKFASEELATTWLAQQISKPYRLPERVVPIASEYLQEDVLETIQTNIQIGSTPTPEVDINGNPVLDENGNQIINNIPIMGMVDTHVSLKAEYTYSIEDTTIADNLEAEKALRLKNGMLARVACQNVLDLIAGYNLERDLTSEQITQMQSTFTNIELALKSSRPSTAKALINGVSVDGVLVSQQMKDDCLALLANY